MKTKKWIALCLTFCLLLTMLCACSSGAPSGDEGEAAETAETTTEETVEEAEVTETAADANTDAFDEYPRPAVVTDRPLKVGYLVRSLGGEIHQRYARQVAIDADHYGWDLNMIVYEQDNLLRESWLNMLNQDVDVILIGNANTFEQYEDLAIQTREAGIGLYCIDNQVIPGVIVNTTVQNGTAMMELMYQVGADYDWNFNYAVMVEEGILCTRERSRALVGFDKAYPNEILVATQDIAAAPTSIAQAGYDFASTWIQQYGEDLDIMFTTSDYHAATATEAVIKAGDTTGEKWIVTGIDGGSQAWSYIRNNTPWKYTYSQPAELYAHNTCEIIQQLQVEGMNPGDEGCILDYSGEVVYSKGVVTTPKNCPAIGTSVHEMFDYYDPDDKDAWYFWDDGKGIYQITDYEEEQ